MFLHGRILRLIVPLCLTAALTAAAPTCKAKLEALTNGTPIATLPKVQREQIIRALLPDLRRFYHLVGGDPTNLEPKQLENILRFKRIQERGDDRLMIVRLVDIYCARQLC